MNKKICIVLFNEDRQEKKTKKLKDKINQNVDKIIFFEYNEKTYMELLHQCHEYKEKGYDVIIDGSQIQGFNQFCIIGGYLIKNKFKIITNYGYLWNE